MMRKDAYLEHLAATRKVGRGEQEEGREIPMLTADKKELRD